MRSVLAGPLPRRWWATRAHPFSIYFTQHVDELAAHTTDPEKS
jgi:hypothetical protein